MPPTDIDFINFNEKEESTCIESITLLKHSLFNAYVLVPVLSVLTLFFLPLKMYWDNALNARMLYYPVQDLRQASHVLVKGRGGNVEVCLLKNMTAKIAPLLGQFNLRESKAHLSNNEFYFFEYRFIKFEYVFEKNLFLPILFHTDLPFDELRHKYASSPMSESEHEV